MQSRLTALSGKDFSTIGKLILAFMAGLYLANAFTPLHLHVDAIRYFNLRTCIEFGCDPASFAAKDFLPIGYTYLLIFLSKIGVLNTISVVIMNCIYLFGGLYLFTRILKEYISPGMIFLLTLFNWTIIKFAIHPLSEMQYLFFSCASLYFFHVYIKRNSYLHLALAFVFCFITILTRTVGIALFPALLAGIAWHHRARLKDAVVRHKFIVVAAITLAALLLFFGKEELKIIDYINFMRKFFDGGLLRFFTMNTTYHATELAEITLNMPSNKIIEYLPARGNYLFIGGGIMLVFWFLYLLLRKSSMPLYMKVYLGCYMLIILNWPYYDPRFWVPVVPLLAALILTFNFNRGAFFKFSSQAFGLLYIAFGFVAAAYSLYLGFNKEKFASSHAKGVYRNEYETHFFGKPLSDTARHTDANVLDILQKHD